jgi:superfamily II DNA or RNA helicase
MRLVTLDGLDLSTVEDMVGSATFARGLAYARDRAVRHMDWDDVDLVLTAIVQGSDDEPYATSVYLQVTSDGGLEFEGSDCECPVGDACKHAVAALVVAAGTPAARPRGSTWATGLEALLGAAATAPDGVPLGVELAWGDAGRGAVVARLVRPGRSGWIAGNLTWGRLQSLYAFGEYRSEHVRLLREWHAMHRSRADHYWSGDERTIDLTGAGERLWSLLEEARRIGVAVVQGKPRTGPIAPVATAQVNLDVTGADEGALTVVPAVLVDDEVVRPVAFLGAEGHGVVYLHPADDAADPARRPIRLARLAAPVPQALQDMALRGARIAVPAGDRVRFAREFVPRLRHLAPVVSSDGAFVPPAISAPTLVLRAGYGEHHEVDVTWQWQYEIDGEPVRLPVDGADDGGFRDLDAEQAVLDAHAAPLQSLALGHGAGVRPRTMLRGLDTMRFTTELVPLLDGAPNVTVEIGGAPADYREAGDSLQIGVSTGEIAGENDWFDLGVSIAVEGREVPFTPVFTALAAGETHLLLADGAYFSLQKPQLQALRALIEEARALQDTPRGPLRISRFQAGLWKELAALGVVDSQARAWREQVSGLLAGEGLVDTPLPSGLTAQMRPYQHEGYRWLCFLQRHGLGGILADDMGLGKTLQTLAMIARARETDPGAPPFLVVAPTSVLANWAGEAARFAPGLRVVTLADTLRKRGQDLAEAIAGADIVVTSYTLFRLDAEAHAASAWSGLVFDEAQFVKNHQSQVHRCARTVPAPFKLAITGTPMENNLMELWSLLSITAPGLFPNPTRFQEHYARPIERQGSAAATELLARLRRRVRPLLTRRTKEQVAPDLPPKQEQVLEITLDPRHRRLYQQHLQRERQKVLGLLDDVDRNRFTILRSITLLRQLALHPGLIDPEHSGLSSAKIDALIEQVRGVVSGGHRALVFSQFTGFLGLVRRQLDEAGVAYAYLDGSTRRRESAVREFTDGTAPVFLISLKAGGFGLNLTEADYCFLLDPWWNPATEAQAVDRTHRIGQDRTVMVYRMLATDTIEEKVHALARRKAALFHGVLDEGEMFSSALRAEDIKELLG